MVVLNPNRIFSFFFLLGCLFLWSTFSLLFGDLESCPQTDADGGLMFRILGIIGDLYPGLLSSSPAW